jgi:hypothetical protein
MDTRQRNLLIRNIIGATILVALFVLFLAWLGVFEGKQSDEAQIRAVMGAAQDEINDHDWDDLLQLCALTPDEVKTWRASIDKSPQARFVVIDAINPTEIINVPGGAEHYDFGVSVIAHLQAPILGKLNMDTPSGRLFFAKVDGQWKLDIKRSAPTFPYVPKP